MDRFIFRAYYFRLRTSTSEYTLKLPMNIEPIREKGFKGQLVTDDNRT